MTMKRPLFTVLASLSILAIALTTTGCLDADTDTSSSASTLAEVTEVEPEDTTQAAEVRAVVDGDTIDTKDGVVRIIGIDTPERAICGYFPALEALEARLQRGDKVTLELPEGQNDEDQYGRILRYVTTEDGIDIGYQQIVDGHAVARYDSRDGYPAHPREEEYHAAQTATLDEHGDVVPQSCLEPEPTAAPPVVESAPVSTDSWWLQYPSCAALKRNTVGHPTGPFNRDDPAQAQLYDYFANYTGNRGDGDGDGLACE